MLIQGFIIPVVAIVGGLLAVGVLTIGPIFLLYKLFGNRTDDFVPKNDTRPISLGSED